MVRKGFSQRYFSPPDLVIFMVVATAIYGVFSIAQEWTSEFQPSTEIHLSIAYLPYYTLLSAIRGIVAYFISLGFTLIVGYVAAKSSRAEKIIIPLLDILQSVPVLGFLPGLMLGLVALFPTTNIGLELAAILMIFTGQVWNMTFGYYSSLKSIPDDFKEASTVIGLGWKERLLNLELPYSAVNLAWNSLLSMAGGWFFLIPCEAMTFGDKEYRIPGIGAYMDVAIQRGDKVAMSMAIVAMVFLIVVMDIVIWRPILSWVRKFRLEQGGDLEPNETLMQVWLRESRMFLRVKLVLRYLLVWTRGLRLSERALYKKVAASSFDFIEFIRVSLQKLKLQLVLKLFAIIMFCLVMTGVGWGAFKLIRVLSAISIPTWCALLKDTIWTLVRILLALICSTLWTVPFGIWLGTSQKRVRVVQPIIQVIASFPQPMLYPLVLCVMFAIGIPFKWSAGILIFMGAQWYVLFNVLAGAMRIPQELSYAISLMKVSRFDRWRVLYLPSIFPFLVTGWVTAAGGAWNASVVAEYMPYEGRILKTEGLGATLHSATESGDFSHFAASLTLMVIVVILFNRLIWSRVYALAQQRYRMEL